MIKALIFIFLEGCILGKANAQTADYNAFADSARKLADAKKYKEAASFYQKAFSTVGGKAYPDDRYNIACCWAMAGYPDSAFSDLNRLVVRVKYHDYNRITHEADLVPLHHDKRWPVLMSAIKHFKDSMKAHINRPLKRELDSIYYTDQHLREQVEDIKTRFGVESKEWKTLWVAIHAADSANELKIMRILDQYGWPGPDVAGDSGSSAVYLVIQHSPPEMEEKYLPVMRSAVKTGKAKAANLAYLEDRVLMWQGKKQIYGSQYTLDKTINDWKLYPIEDELNVNKRRAEVGLEPLEGFPK